MALTKSSVLLLMLLAVCVRGDGLLGKAPTALASGAGPATPSLHDMLAGIVALPGVAARAKLDLLHKALGMPAADTPNLPGTPGLPGTPSLPGTPVTPGTPGTPGIPGVAVSGARQTPGVPATPPTAGTPGKPGVPPRAGTPGTQSQCNMDGLMKDLSLTRTLKYMHEAGISIPKGSTFFAPTDAAWNAFLAPFNAKQRATAADPRLLSLLLRNHVAPESMLTSSQLGDGMRIPTELRFQTVLSPETLTVSNRDLYRGSFTPTKLYTLRTSDVRSPGAKITMVDQESTCAVMHVVDHVLAPRVLLSLLTSSQQPAARPSGAAATARAAVRP